MTFVLNATPSVRVRTHKSWGSGDHESLHVARSPPRYRAAPVRKSRVLTGKACMLLLLVVGTALNVTAQYIIDKGFAAPEAQLLSCAKYAAMLAWSVLSPTRAADGVSLAKARRLSWCVAQPKQRIEMRGRVLLVAVALLDVTAYALLLIGLATCGTATSSVLLAACCQAFTAALSMGLLRRPMSRMQAAAVALVCVGVALRGGPALLSHAETLLSSILPWEVALATANGGASNAKANGAAAGAAAGFWGDADARRHCAGLGCVALASLLYSLMGIAYERLLQQRRPPSHALVLAGMAAVGTMASTVYELIYTLPRWGRLITQPAAAAGVGFLPALAMLALYCVLCNLQAYAQSVAFEAEGAVGVAISNAMRSGAVSLAAGALFCSPATPRHCLTPWAVASAATVGAGVALWALAPKPLAATAAAVAEGAGGGFGRGGALHPFRKKE